MTAQEFVDHLYRKYYPELEGPILALRKALAELDPRSRAFTALMQRQALRELRHALAFTKALLQYRELDHHERAEVAEQAAEEYKHYALIKDFLRNRGEDVADIDVDAYDAYFGRFLTGDVNAFRLCNIAEKSAVVFMAHLRDVSRDPEVRKLAAAILSDEEGHGDRIRTKLEKMAEDESKREFLENQFVQSWRSQKEGVYREARELGINVEEVLERLRREIEERR